MIISSIFAGIATLCSSCAYIPQLLKTCQSKSTKGISLYWLCYIALGAILWDAYGFLVGDVFLMATHSFVLSLVTCMLIVKLRQTD